MKKPKKKIIDEFEDHECLSVCLGCVGDGYNGACDDWEAWLPNEEELFEYIMTETKLSYPEDDVRRIAQAIAKRLGKGR